MQHLSSSRLRSVSFFRRTALVGAFLLATATTATQAQSVGVGTASPAASAAVDVTSTTQGFLPPRMTSAQRAAIANPVSGLTVYQTDGDYGLYVWMRGVWVSMQNGREPDANGSVSTFQTNGGVVTTLAGLSGTSGAVNGTGSAARFNTLFAVVVGAGGNLYVTESGNHVIRKITPQGVVTTYAGLIGSSGLVNGPLATARFNNPGGLAQDADGNLYVADRGNFLIRKITPQGVVSTFAGTPGVQGDGNGTGVGNATLRFIAHMAFDLAGNLYAVESGNGTIRRITPGGTVSLFAGVPGSNTSSTNGPALSATFWLPLGVAVDAAGTVYVSESIGRVIRKIAGGTVSSWVGDGTVGSTDGTGTATSFQGPAQMAFDADGNLYVANVHNVRRITPGAVVTRLAGGDHLTSGTTDGTGTAARFNGPRAVAVGRDGVIYVVDGGNHSIRVIK